MIKVKILSINKTKEAWLQLAIDEYSKRLSNQIKIEFIFFKDQNLLKKFIDNKKYFCLDERGENFSSKQFSNLLFNNFQSEFIFVIGGAEGILKEILENAKLKICLSPMTFPHQICRLLLVEQIYRASQIFIGTKYHK